MLITVSSVRLYTFSVAQPQSTCSAFRQVTTEAYLIKHMLINTKMSSSLPLSLSWGVVGRRKVHSHGFPGRGGRYHCHRKCALLKRSFLFPEVRDAPKPLHRHACSGRRCPQGFEADLSRSKLLVDFPGLIPAELCRLATFVSQIPERMRPSVVSRSSPPESRFTTR